MTSTQKKNLFDEMNVSLVHVGINFNSANESSAAADFLCNLLGKSKREIPGKSYFVGEQLELMNDRSRGTCGHICYATDDIKRTLEVLDEEGIAIDWENASYFANGKPRLVYLKNEYYGFAIHFIQR